MHGSQWIKRQYQELIDEYLKYFPCVGIIGSRQCGKTTMLANLDSSWKIFDLEKGSDYDYISRDPDLFFRLYPGRVAIDEAQILPSLFNAMRVAIDKERSQKGRFIITGSSSPDLLESISESLAGRIGIIELAPLLLSEILESKSRGDAFYTAFRDPSEFLDNVNHMTPAADVQFIHQYWLKGGYPEPWVKNDERFREVWNTQYIRTYLERDISRLFPGLNKHRFRQFIGMLANLSGSILNYSDLARSLAVSQPTIREYFRIAHGTFVWRQIQPYEKNVQKRIIKHPKGYLRDSGIRHYLLRINDLEGLLTHPAMGKSWESMVSEEILRGLDCRGIDYDYYYYRTASGAELDLVLEGKFGLIPIEIKYTQSIRPSDLHVIRGFMNEHACPLGLVITNDENIRPFSGNLAGIPFACCL